MSVDIKMAEKLAKETADKETLRAWKDPDCERAREWHQTVYLVEFNRYTRIQGQRRHHDTT